MISYDAKINNSVDFHLVEWDRNSFGTIPNLLLATDNFNAVKEAFEHIEKIEIYRNDMLVCETTEYTTYASINYLGEKYSVGENTSYPCMRVDLTRANLVEQVDRLNKEVFDEEDPSTMSLEEYRAWLLKDIGKKCRNDIYAGAYVRLSDGTKHFSYNSEDQQNIQSAVAILLSVPELPSMPYHADGEFCYMMPKADLFRVYLTLHLRLVMLTTRCNFLNMYIKSIEYREELEQITYESELPPAYQEQLNQVAQAAEDMATVLIEKYIGELPDEIIEPTEPEQEQEPENTDPVDETPQEPESETPQEEEVVENEEE